MRTLLIVSAALFGAFFTAAAPLYLAAAPASMALSSTQQPAPPAQGDTILRLTRQRLAQASVAKYENLALPLDSRWTASSPQALETTRRGLEVTQAGGPVLLFLGITIEAARYNEVVLSMKASQGDQASLNWLSDLEPAYDSNPGIVTPILADGQFHTYILRLDGIRCETWAGKIRQLRFLPSSAPADITVDSIIFRYTPPEAPARITIDHQTHEALPAPQAPWRVSVPPNGVFECQVGIAERAWGLYGADGARFTATAKAPGANAVSRVLFDQVLNPSQEPGHRKWVPFRCPLQDFAGKEVEISLEVDHLRGAIGDYAYWGNPVIYSPAGAPPRPPVILISCDTLRADHLPFYGYARDTAPHLTAWSAETVVFENAICQETWTPTSHMTMLTGLYPKNHGLTTNANLAEGVPTLADVLSAQGFLTAAYTGHSWWLLPWRGFAQGFDLYNTPEFFRDANQTHALAAQWLKAHRANRPFLFVHNYDIHSQLDGEARRDIYAPTEDDHRVFSKAFQKSPDFTREGADTPAFTQFLMAHNQDKLQVTEEERDYLVAGYDDCIHYVDQSLGDFFDTLKENGLYDSALIIVTADHGEEFGEHGKYLHNQVYDECARVPLLIKFPNGQFAGRRVKDMVRLTDLYATILDVLGMESPAPSESSSLVSLLKGEARHPGTAFTQRHAFQAIRTADRKFIRSMKTDVVELYDLASDPHETVNIAAQDGEQGKALSTALGAFFDAPAGGWHVQFENDGTPWKGNITLSTEDRFVGATMKRFDRIESIDLQIGDYRIEGTIQLTPMVKSEVLTFQTASPDAPVHLVLKSETPFAFRTFKTDSSDILSIGLTLDPAQDRAEPPKASGQENNPIPRVHIWHTEPAAGQTPAKELPAEAIDQLRGLGYL